MSNTISNILTNIPTNLQEELFENIVLRDNLKIQRIVSYGHTTEESKWYNQDNDEWVVLFKGEAIISFEDEDDVKLEVGDYLNIPAHKKHKVSWTKENTETIWLAIHY